MPMVPASMIPDFVAEIRDILEETNFRLRDETGEFLVPAVFAHDLPPAQKGTIKTPWVLVSLYNGEQSSASDPRTATLHITCMVYDDAQNMQGYQDAMNLLERVCQSLYGKGTVAKKYDLLYPYQFAVLDDVRYPYFSAGMVVRVQLPGVTPQNPIGGYQYV